MVGGGREEGRAAATPRSPGRDDFEALRGSYVSRPKFLVRLFVVVLLW